VTEQEWLNTTDLDQLLLHLNAEGLKDDRKVRSLRELRAAPGDQPGARYRPDSCGASGRKLQLFACACCRRIWHALTDERSRVAVEVTERYADGLAAEDEMDRAADGAYAAMGYRGELPDPEWQSAFHGPKAVCQMLTIRRIPLSWADAGISADQATIGLFYDQLRRRGRDIERQVPDEEIDWVEEGAIRDAENQAQCAILRDIFGNPFRPIVFSSEWLTPTVSALAWQMYQSRDFSAMPILADALQDAECDNDDMLDHCRGPGPHVRGCWVVDLLLNKG
jgi:hypothetical protein